MEKTSTASRYLRESRKNITTPRHLAGSAIAQGSNVGRIDKWSDWKPTKHKCRWLLLSGASNPPCTAISDRRTRDCHGARGGTFLSGVGHDLKNMEAAVKPELFNIVRDCYLTKSAALNHIRRLFEICSRYQAKPMLYYTGHGEKETGNWCFEDGEISIEEILRMRPKGTYYPMIFSDTCYSGHWANFCLQKNIDGFHCLAACPEYSKAIDTGGEGGDLTLFMTGRKERPSTEPLYSGGNRKDFPITTGYDSAPKYTKFVESYLVNSQNIVISQSFHNGYLSAIFAPKGYTSRPVVSCASPSDDVSFNELAENESKHISSLACDEKLGFGVTFMENYGSAQTILTNTSDIENLMKEGFKITACAAWGSTFYFIMTKGLREYRGKQEWFIKKTWGEAAKLFQENQDKKRIVTGICYSTGQKMYLVVVMETSQEQIYKKVCDVADLDNWMKVQHKEGFHPTIVFQDPTDNKTLVAMVKDGKKVPYICKYGCKVSFA